MGAASGGQQRAGEKLESTEAVAPERVVRRSPAKRLSRRDELRRVYYAFDLDASGDVGRDELMALGQARRKLGDKVGEWTSAKTDDLVKRIGVDRSGNVKEEPFVDYFDLVLPLEPEEFSATVVQFMECAAACARAKAQSPTKKPTKKQTPTRKAVEDGSKSLGGSKGRSGDDRGEGESAVSGGAPKQSPATAVRQDAESSESVKSEEQAGGERRVRAAQQSRWRRRPTRCT